MHLSKLFIENFRLFGSQANGQHLVLDLQPGLNVLVGENDCGKTAIVDAIRLLLGSSSQEYTRVTRTDFHVADSGPASQLVVRATFSGLTDDEQDLFLEHLTLEEGSPPLLHLTLTAAYPQSGRERAHRIVRVGRDGAGSMLDEREKEYLEVTYLRPLRDAETALMAGRGSRLAQILLAHPDYKSQHENDFDAEDPSKQPTTLVGILRQAEHRIKNNPIVLQTQDTLNERFLRSLSLGDTPLKGTIGISSTDLRQVLEKLDLALEPLIPNAPPSRRGLGLHNLLFIAAELLLLKEDRSSFPLLLIEEPEAHLHPQQQICLIDFLQAKTSTDQAGHESTPRESDVGLTGPIQIILTTHSPILASKVALEKLVLLAGGRAFPLSPSYTRLAPDDYPYLARFLDSTKANLFFARGVLLVEGDSENILLPTVAELLGRPFSRYGVSMVNVGTSTPIRYARILQQRTGGGPPIRVACIRDRDILPKAAREHFRPPGNRKGPYYEEDLSPEKITEIVAAKREFESDHVRVFVSPFWTLEYDLARCGMALELYQAVNIAEDEQEAKASLNDEDFARSLLTYAGEFAAEHGTKTLEETALAVYVLQKKDTRTSKPAVAQVLARILSLLNPADVRSRLPGYIVDAVEFVTGAIV